MNGLKEMLNKLDKIEKELDKSQIIALKKETLRIMGDSLEHYAPQDQGDLIQSSYINEPTKENGSFTIDFGYGKEGSKAKDYAVALHEHPSASSPPTWEGKALKFSKPGTGPKYLELPLFKAIDGMNDRLAQDIKIK